MSLSYISPKDVLITGAMGFLGRHLFERLSRDENLSVTGLDRQQSFRPGMIHRDIRRGIPYRKWDVIYHLACSASPPVYQKRPVDTLLTAVEGTREVLKAAGEAGARVILLSTSEVYGSQVEVMHEKSWGLVNPVGPRACYDEGKRCAEALAMAYRQEFGQKVTIVRPFNVYGPGMAIDDGRILPNFVKAALLGESIHIYGTGRQVRCYCYVDDFIEGLVRLMDFDPPAEELPILNLGTSSMRTVVDVALTVLQATDSQSRIVHVDSVEDDPPCRVPSVERAGQWIGWKPEVAFTEGISRMAADFRRRMNLEAG